MPCIVNRRLRPLDAYAKYLSAAGKAQRTQLSPSSPPPRAPVALKNVNRLMQQQLTHISSAAQTFAQSNGVAGLTPLSLSPSLTLCLAPKCMLHIIIDGVRGNAMSTP